MAGRCSPNRSRKPSIGAASPELAQEVACLLALDASALKQRWVELFGSEPPPCLGRSFMVRAFAYLLQERALGSLKPSTLRILERVADEPASVESKRASVRKVGAGTVLIREWGGVTHRVTVLDNDVVYRGRRYKSLSEVARAITGSHWSGPVFFGLKNGKKVAANG